MIFFYNLYGIYFQFYCDLYVIYLQFICDFSALALCLHTVTEIKRVENWKIQHDWYLFCLKEKIHFRIGDLRSLHRRCTVADIIAFVISKAHHHFNQRPTASRARIGYSVRLGASKLQNTKSTLNKNEINVGKNLKFYTGSPICICPFFNLSEALLGSKLIWHKKFFIIISIFVSLHAY